MADEPDKFPLIPLPYTPIVKSLGDDIIGMLAIEMSIVHNVFIRGLNSIWRNAPLVKPADGVAFAGYCQVWSKGIHQHHHAEESIIFPFLQTKVDMNDNLQQHEAFLKGLGDFDEYLEKVIQKTETFDSARILDLVAPFSNILVEHLHGEIATISPEKLKVFEEDTEGLREMTKKLEDHIKNQPNQLKAFPYVATHHDRKDAPNWPPAPAPLKWFVRNIAVQFNRKYWRFSPFTPAGSPQVYN